MKRNEPNKKKWTKRETCLKKGMERNDWNHNGIQKDETEILIDSKSNQQ